MKKCALKKHEMAESKSFEKKEHKAAKHTPKKVHKPAGKGKFAKVMKEFTHGSLHSGSKKGPKVTDPKQALAISYLEARKASRK